MSAVMDEEFAAPASSVGFVWEDHKAALLIIEPHALETGIITSFGDKDAVRATIRVVDGPDAGGIYEDSLVFPKALIGQLKSSIGKKVLGRLAQGVAKPGQKPPWLLSDPTPDDITAAKASLATPTPTAAAAPF